MTSISVPRSSSRSNHMHSQIILVNTWEQVESACQKIIHSSEGIIAFDLEGVNLGRNGQLTLLQIAIDQKTVFCFDVLVLGKQLFEHRFLGGIFFSPRIVKVCFDCRVDGDVLYSHFGVRINMLYDIQILYTSLFQSRKDPFLKGLRRVLQHPDVIQHKGTLEKVIQCKQRIKERLDGSMHHMIFLARPLTPEILEYCSCDVVYLLRMHAIWSRHDGGSHHILRATMDRLMRFCTRREPIPPWQMSMVDFSPPTLKPKHDDAS